MNDLENFLVMLSRSNTDFTKQTMHHKDVRVTLPKTENQVTFSFDVNGKFEFLHISKKD